MTREEETWNSLVSLGVISGEIPSGEWDLSGADLSGADLSGASLIKANLCYADLRGTDLSGANLSRASLRGANLSGANLSGASLREADLGEADLSEVDLVGATLFNADLTRAVLNGASIDYANLSRWIIKDIVCTHLIERKDFDREIQFDPYEFEKKYTYIPKIVEMILNIPLTDSASLIGKFITQSINYCEKSSVISLKGVEAITDNDTKFTFIVYDDGFFDTKGDKIQIVKDQLNKYFKGKTLETIRDDLYDPVKDAPNGLISTREDVPIRYTPYQIHPKAVGEKAIEFYIKMGKLGETIHNIIFKTFR